MTRIAVWRWLTRNVSPGQILPARLIACQVVLFPRRSLLWLLNRDCGFDLMTCCWTIHGTRFSDAIFVAMAQPRPGIAYCFERDPRTSLVTIREFPLPAEEGQCLTIAQWERNVSIRKDIIGGIDD